MIYKMRLHPEPYSAIKKQTKTIELRLNDEKRQLIKIGDFIEFINRQNSEKILTQVIKIHKFSNFQELYSNFDKISLGYSPKEIADYHDMEKYYSKEEQNKYGVIGIEIKLIKKIYIIGPVASGKTTLAKKLSSNYNLQHYELDKLIWDDSQGIKRPTDEIKKEFNRILKQDNFIIEDVGRNIFTPAFEKVDIVIYLDYKQKTLKIRIFKRWLKQKLGLEPFNYQPTIKTLFEMSEYLKKDIQNRQEKITLIKKTTSNYKIIKKVSIINDEIYFY